MRVIHVMFDSLNRHHLGPYGCDWTVTPNFRRLAERAVTFDRHYVGSMPCMPARRELHTGRYNFLHRSWGPFEPFDDSIHEQLRDAGVYSHLVSDHYHYWEDGGATYHHRYSSWENVRGQEHDRWKGVVDGPERPEHLGSWCPNQAVNRRWMQREEDTPQARTFQLGLDFIRQNHTADDWLLQIETFDPHEPFFTLHGWKAHYPHRWDGPLFDWPNYDRVRESRAAVEHMRFEYAALLTQCDHSLGRVLDVMDELDLWQDTVLVVNTDHGFLLGEHDWWAKTACPWYNEIAHIPLFIWDPRSGRKGTRFDHLTQTIDLPATLLEVFGQPLPEHMQGRPLGPAVAADHPVRDFGLFGIFGGHANITDGHRVYMRAPPGENGPLFHYTHMPTHMNALFSVEELRQMTVHPGFPFTKGCPVMKIPGRGQLAFHDLTTRLYDLATDPAQEHPLDDGAGEARMVTALRELMAATAAPPEQFQRLGL